jgi:ribulose-bisphosphate carboxylase large chain
LFGQIMRLAGADAVIFPHAGGRFGFSPEECREVAAGTQAPLGGCRTIFPAPGGGMSLARIPELLKFYGNEVIFLVGGDLLRNRAEIEKSCERYRKMVDSA